MRFGRSCVCSECSWSWCSWQSGIAVRADRPKPFPGEPAHPKGEFWRHPDGLVTWEGRLEVERRIQANEEATVSTPTVLQTLKNLPRLMLASYMTARDLDVLETVKMVKTAKARKEAIRQLARANLKKATEILEAVAEALDL